MNRPVYKMPFNRPYTHSLYRQTHAVSQSAQQNKLIRCVRPVSSVFSRPFRPTQRKVICFNCRRNGHISTEAGIDRVHTSTTLPTTTLARPELQSNQGLPNIGANVYRMRCLLMQAWAPILAANISIDIIYVLFFHLLNANHIPADFLQGVTISRISTQVSVLQSTLFRQQGDKK